MNELVTAKYLKEPPEDELTLDPNVHPTTYVHERCGGVTEMPARVRRNYLADPYFYWSDTICASCGGPVPDSQCYWTETGENLRHYMRRLKQAKPRGYHIARFLLPLMFGIALTLLAVLGTIKQGKPVTPSLYVVGILIGAIVGWLPSKFIRLFMCRLGWI